MAREKALDNKVKAYLKEYGAWGLKYWAGSRFTKDGIPDLLYCINGYFFGIEDKAENGKPSLLQLYNLRKIREAGGLGILLYPKDFDNFKKFIANIDKNSSWYLENIELQKKWEEKIKN